MKRRYYRASFIDLEDPLTLRTLTRGEIFDCYLQVGCPQRELPPKASLARTRLETLIFDLGCLDPPEDILAVHVGRIAHEVLRLSGFLEGTEEQQQIHERAFAYSRSPEARGDALIMATFMHYGLEELHDMSCEEWDRLVFLAVTVQSEVYGTHAKEFLTQTPVEPSQLQQENPSLSPNASGLSDDFIQRTFGLRSYRANGSEQTVVRAGGGTITPESGHVPWGDSRAS